MRNINFQCESFHFIHCIEPDGSAVALLIYIYIYPLWSNVPLSYIGIVHLSKRVQQLSSQRCVSLSDLHFRCMTNLIILYTPKEKMYALYRRSTKFFCCPNMCLSHFSHSIKERTQRSTRTKKKKKSLNTVYIQQHSTTPTRASPYNIYDVSRLQSRENFRKIYSQLYPIGIFDLPPII